MTPRYLVLRMDYDPETGTDSYQLGPERPRVIMMSRRAKTLYGEVLCRRAGYRPLWHDWALCLQYWARPWPVWAWLKMRHSAHDLWWRALGDLWQAGVIHSRQTPGVITRFRDMRLGPGE